MSLCTLVISQALSQRWAVVSITPPLCFAGVTCSPKVCTTPARQSVASQLTFALIPRVFIRRARAKPVNPAVIARNLLALQSERGARISAIPPVTTFSGRLKLFYPSEPNRWATSASSHFFFLVHSLPSSKSSFWEPLRGAAGYSIGPRVCFESTKQWFDRPRSTSSKNLIWSSPTEPPNAIPSAQAPTSLARCLATTSLGNSWSLLRSGSTASLGWDFRMHVA